MKYIDAATKTGKFFEPGDELDLPKAMINGVTRTEPGTENAIKLRMAKLRSDKKKWDTKAERLLETMGIPVKTIYSTEDLQKLSENFTGHNFLLFTREKGEKLYKPTYSTGDEGIQIDLMVFQGSYGWFKPCRSKTGYMTCEHCREIYKRQTSHACKNCCPKCRFPRKDCPRDGSNYDKVCSECNRLFYTEACYLNHLRKWKTRDPACIVFKKCIECERQYTTRNGDHVCGERYCDTCQTQRPFFHACCWTPPTDNAIQKLRAKEEEFKFVIFDCETVQTRTVDDIESYIPEHFVCFLFYSLLCHVCIGSEDSYNSPCENRGVHKKGYFRHRRGEPRNIAISKFLHMLLRDSTLNKSIVIGHNAGRFDHHFFIPEILRLGIRPTVIKRGSKIIQMNINNTPDFPCNDLKFRDSFLFINTKLSNLPKTFGFAGAKTYFPYTFCVEDSYGVQLPQLPAKKYYGVKNMSPAEYTEFNKWYRANRHQSFDFDKILHLYGENDVEVLHRGIEGYIKTTIALTSWNPIVQSCTFASFSFFLIKNEHIQKNMVGIIPENGYFANQNASKMANKWLQWVSHSEGVSLQTKLNGGEKELQTESGRTIRLDGYCGETNTAYEFLGDYWHGNEQVYKAETINPTLKKPMGDLYRETNERLAEIRKQCNLKMVWELEIKRELASNSEMRNYFEMMAYTSRLIAQDGMAGGRTQCFWTYYKARPYSKIYMMDCVSLYPSVLMKTPLPVGQPEVITENFEPINPYSPLPYKGMYKVDVLPPKGLLHPVVWMRIKGRLIYSLCRTCAIKEQKTIYERKIHCTLYHLELQLALDEGYRVLRCYEVWSWFRFQSDLYRGFLGGYIKTKLEKSGLPRKNMTEEEIGAWIAEVSEMNEGIQIERENIEDNVQMRTIAKMAINSSWAKFIEKSVKSEVAFFKMDEDPPAILDSDRYEITGITTMTENVEMVTYQIKEEFARPKTYSSTIFGSITTSAGRVELYKVLKRLQDRCLYTDTDSVIFHARANEDRLLEVEGSHLGGWKSELDAELGEEILEFASCGPKVYSYRKRDKSGKITEVTKTRGVTLDKDACFEINFNGIQRLVEDLNRGKVSTLTTERPQILRKLGHISTRQMRKVTKPVMTKVLFDASGRTRPYGWTDTTFVPIDLSKRPADVLSEDDEEHPGPLVKKMNT